jgi:hypothetical protein
MRSKLLIKSGLSLTFSFLLLPFAFDLPLPLAATGLFLIHRTTIFRCAQDNGP